MSSVINTFTHEFDDHVLNSDLPVLVDFWAQWCMPCKQIAPIVSEIASEYQGNLKVVKVNVDECSDLAKKYGIRGIPTLLVFKNGRVQESKVGALNKQQLTKFVIDHI